MKKRRSTGGVQMFSFLDAMVCTLGALLVLLHAFARHGQINAVRKAEAKAAQEASEDPQGERAMLEWRVDQLKKVRAKTEAQLSDERMRLSHVEDHQRRLQEKFKQLKIAATELDRLKETDGTAHLRDQAALKAARVRLVEARATVEKARRDGQQAATYSVVPYEGPNSTHRRPMYIECLENKMILQPEGVELSPADFAGFFGPGNPLAQALRATREYCWRRAPLDTTDSEPYPLLLVRPEGVKTYYAARAALHSWSSDYGYELIGSDWKLEFMEPDERLAQSLREITGDARLRMRDLRMATAQLNAHRPRTTLRASSSGGFVVDNVPRGRGRHRPTRSSDSDEWDSPDSDWAQADAESPSPDGDVGSGESQHEDTPSGSALHSGDGHLRDDRSPSHQTDASSASGQGGPSTSGAAEPSEPGADGSKASDSDSPAPPSPNHKPSKTTSLAKMRGRDWGLPDAGSGMAPATRPILVECHNDRLVIVPENHGAPAEVTPLGSDARENIDDFVSDVWQHMKGWGIAGRGLYWRPTLVMSIGPGAAERYAEIKALLAESGLDVRVRRPRAAGTSPTSNSIRR